MEFGHGKIRMNVKVDRLSSLPDELIHEILSFISIRQAIQTSVLSSRWRSIWTSMPYLNSSTQKLLPEFVSNLLSRRNSQIPVSSIKLGHVSDASVKRILDYTFSHNVQQLTLTWDRRSCFGFPLCLFSSRSLKHLALIGGIYELPRFKATASFDLPLLTTLHLHHITLAVAYNISDDIGLFTNCTNLKNLSLSRCWILGTYVFNICHPRLSNLTLENTHECPAVNVVAPQLKNLTAINSFHVLSIDAPALTSLVMRHSCHMELSTQGLPLLENVDLSIFCPNLKPAHVLVALIEQLHTVKSLTLNLEIIEFVCPSLGLMSHRISPFANLKMVKFLASYPKTRVYFQEVTNSTEIENYQLDDSPSGDLKMVSCEEIRVMRNLVSSQKLIAEFKRQRTESSLESHWRFVQAMAQKLSEIEGLLSELPASKRKAMQPTFSTVCEALF